MTLRHRVEQWYPPVLLLAAIGLAAILARASAFQNRQEVESPASAPPSGSLPTPPPLTPLPGILSKTTPASLYTESSDHTPADAWAAALLNRLLMNIPSANWEDQTVLPLRLTGSALVLGEDPLTLDAERRLQLLVANAQTPSAAQEVGAISPEGGALVLSVSRLDASQSEASWRLSSGSARMALAALVDQALLQGIVLTASYQSGAVPQLIFYGAMSADQVVATLPDPPRQAVQPTSTPALSSPTPTRVPEEYLGQVVAGKLAPIITAAIEYDPDMTRAFIERHPWTGVLDSTAEGIRVGGRLIPVMDARQMTFYAVAPGDLTGHAERFLTVIITAENTTRFPDDRIYFQGHRFEEILDWVIVVAAEKGGRLVVAYDDLGLRQAVTIIGFVYFDTPLPGS